MRFIVLMLAFGLCSAQSGDHHDWPSSGEMEKLMKFGIDFFCETKDEFQGICEDALEKEKDHHEDKELIGKIVALGEKCEEAVKDFLEENPGLGKYFKGEDIGAAKEDFEILKEHFEGMGEKPEKPNRNPKESPKKFKVAKEGETAMGEAENMVDMVDKKRGPKEIMADIHMGCKAVEEWEDYAENISGYESFDDDEFCREHAPEDPARAVARRMLF